MYVLFGEEYDIDDLCEELSKLFWQMIFESGGHDLIDKLDSDGPMKRETFNNWVDSLCKEGHLCDQGGFEGRLTYEACEARARKWI